MTASKHAKPIHGTAFYFLSRRRPPIALAMAIASLLLGFLFCNFSTATASNSDKNKLEVLIANRRTTYFVAVSGNDNGPGTADQPWATINHAAEQVKPGGTVVVRGGHFVLHAQVRPRNSGGLTPGLPSWGILANSRYWTLRR